MADNRIRFSIESVFHGEGFQKTANAVKQTSGVVKSAADGVRNLSAELSGMGGVVSKVSDGVGKLMSVFLAGGPLSIAIAGVTLLVSWFQKMRAEAEEQEKKQRELALAMEEGYRKKVAEAAAAAAASIERTMKIAVEGAEAAIKRIDRLSASYKALKNAQGEVNAANLRLGAARLDLDSALGGSELNQVRNEIKKAGLKYAKALDDAAEGEMAAHKEVQAWKAKIKQQQDIIHALEVACEDTTEAQAKLSEMTTSLHVAEKHLEAKQIERVAIETEREATVEKLTAKERELMAAEEDLRAKVAERADREGDAAVKAAELANAQDLAAIQIDDLKTKTGEAVESLGKQIEAQDAYIEEIKKLQQRAQSGMAADAAHTNGMFGPYNYSTDENGNINDYEDWQRANRFAGRAERDRANQDRRNQRIQDRADELQRKKDAGKKLTADEERELERAKKFGNQMKDLKAEEEKKKQLEEERKKLIDKLGKDVDEIKKNLKKALEVA